MRNAGLAPQAASSHVARQVPQDRPTPCRSYLPLCLHQPSLPGPSEGLALLHCGT